MYSENGLNKDNLVCRLNRIEGQIRGIKNMLEQNKPSQDILMQISSAKSALNNISAIILKSHVEYLIENAEEKNESYKGIDEFMELIKKYIN